MPLEGRDYCGRCGGRLEPPAVGVHRRCLGCGLVSYRNPTVGVAVVVVDGEILGKPGDEVDAMRMLRLLSGRTHHVTTGVCLMGPLGSGNQKLKTGFEDTRSERTLVTMCTLTDEDIRSYIASGEPMDKAGAYAIQGIASRWIPRIEGDYFNVVGLPVSLVYRMLQEHGLGREKR